MEYGLPSLSKMQLSNCQSIIKSTLCRLSSKQTTTNCSLIGKKKLARIIQFKQGNRGFFSDSEKDTSEEEPKLEGTLSIPPRFGKR
ncbi:hypothetical protein TYRP_003115 [Tyrophagus putrescentiae]|nr:hypothetical protein TYRP_003115 [Tyrophagus putrescentiae]